MAKLTFDTTNIEGEISNADSRMSVWNHAYGHLSFYTGYCDIDEDMYFTVTVNGKTLPQDGEFELGFRAMVDGLDEIEALHSYLGLIINQYKSLPINKK